MKANRNPRPTAQCCRDWGFVMLVPALFADVQSCSVRKSYGESLIEGTIVDLSDADAGDHDNDSCEEVAVLARVKAHVGQFFVAFKGRKTAHLPDEVIVGASRKATLQDSSRTEAAVRTSQFLFGALQHSPELHHGRRGILNVHIGNS